MRGAGLQPGDAGLSLGGARVPRLYQFGGRRAIVPSSLVRGLDFTPGAYGPRYGRGLGGLVEVAVRGADSARPTHSEYV